MVVKRLNNSWIHSLWEGWKQGSVRMLKNPVLRRDDLARKLQGDGDHGDGTIESASGVHWIYRCDWVGLIFAHTMSQRDLWSERIVRVAYVPYSKKREERDEKVLQVRLLHMHFGVLDSEERENRMA